MHKMFSCLPHSKQLKTLVWEVKQSTQALIL